MKIKIRAADIKISMGHQSHDLGCGSHKDKKRDKKLRRQRERDEARRAKRSWRDN